GGRRTARRGCLCLRFRRIIRRHASRSQSDLANAAALRRRGAAAPRRRARGRFGLTACYPDVSPLGPTPGSEGARNPMSFNVKRSNRAAAAVLALPAWAWNAPGNAHAEAAAFDAMARGRLLTQWFMAGQLDSLDGVWNAQMAALMKAPQLENFYS